MEVVGQITDRRMNYDFYDRFLEYRVDLRQALIFLTANNRDDISEIIRSRCKFVHIPLLSFVERLEILRKKRMEFIRDYFPSSSREIDRDNELNEILTSQQQKISDKISDEFLAKCLTRE